MKLSLERNILLKPLQRIISIIDRRHTIPLLSHMLLIAEPERITLIATDLEIELTIALSVPVEEPGKVALSAKKLLEICRSLPDGEILRFSTPDPDRVLLRAGKARFTLVTLSGEGFPSIESGAGDARFTIPASQIKKLIERTHFAMAQQDVRYYLNGLLLEFTPSTINAVATDGHRLAFCQAESHAGQALDARQIILPRKGVLELLRLLEEDEQDLQVEVGPNHIRLSWPGIILTSKLIDARFPDYQRVFPQNPDKKAIIDKGLFKQALARIAILSNEKFRGTRLELQPGRLRLFAQNAEHEQAEEELEIGYAGDPMAIGFNVSYLLDIVSLISTDEVVLLLTAPNSSCLIVANGDDPCKYILMPMRL